MGRCNATGEAGWVHRPGGLQGGAFLQSVTKGTVGEGDVSDFRAPIKAVNLLGEEIILQSKSPQPKGYAARPGTGPEGETCGSCKNLYRKQMSKTYLKCLLQQQCWTGGAGTDVKARSPACRFWESASA